MLAELESASLKGSRPILTFRNFIDICRKLGIYQIIMYCTNTGRFRMLTINEVVELCEHYIYHSKNTLKIEKMNTRNLKQALLFVHDTLSVPYRRPY